ncbi:MAG: DUF5688 family protein [Eubacterium sp.]|nr:DUF5688 family protein [Eubacterium sp.]
MKYEYFTEDLKEKLSVFVKEHLDDGTVVIRNVMKNNGVRMKAVSIIRKEEKATPSIYLGQYYQEYRNGRSMDSICKEIFGIYLESMETFRKRINIEQLGDFETVKDKIYYRLINYEMNRTMLDDVPHFCFLDLAIVFYLCLDCDEEGITSVLIHNFNLETWEKTPEEIREFALKNTWEKYPVWIRDIEEVVSEMIMRDLRSTIHRDNPGVVEEESFYGNYNVSDVKRVIQEEVRDLKAEKDMKMYVMSNQIRLNGAACITYPGVLRDFAREHNSNLCIIPSSVHEVILIVGTEWDLEWLNKMVRQVNKEDLEPIDILSDHIYIYDREKEEIVY